MMLSHVRRHAGAWLLVVLVSVACGETGTNASSETNWLRICRTSDDCSVGSCQCGVCTATCGTDANCGDFRNAVCAGDGTVGHYGQCGASGPTEGICLPQCDSSASCGAGQECAQGVCVLNSDPAAGGSGGAMAPATSGNPSGGAGGESAPCPGNPRSQCAVDCSEEDCGAPDSTFDANGCVRDICYNDGDCSPDERCGYINGNEGGAPGESEACISPYVCEEVEGACVCGGSGECAGYCLPR